MTENKRPRVLVNFLQDFSGSIGHGWKETASGFKTFVNTLKSKEDVEYIFSLTLFSTGIHKLVVARPIQDVDGDMLKNLRPNGGTALCDAFGSGERSRTEIRSTSVKLHLTLQAAVV